MLVINPPRKKKITQNVFRIQVYSPKRKTVLDSREIRLIYYPSRVDTFCVWHSSNIVTHYKMSISLATLLEVSPLRVSTGTYF